MYIGSGKDFTNDSSLANQGNEVVETNGGRVFYSSTDQKGDFRVGEVFLVDQRQVTLTSSQHHHHSKQPVLDYLTPLVHKHFPCLY